MIVEKFDNVEDFIKELPKYLGMCHVHPSCLEYLSDIRAQLSELKEIKDAEEQGLLLRLPCKIGDVAWAIRHYRGTAYAQKGFVSEIYFAKNMRLQIVVKNVARGEFGKKVFLTKEEAEQALAEMKGV